MDATTATRITYKGQAWDVIGQFTEDDGTTAHIISRTCTGHWAGGQWVGTRHRVQGTLTDEQIKRATVRTNA